MEGEDYERFIPTLCPIADKTFTLEPESETISQPALL
jgi:hypothetical protein